MYDINDFLEEKVDLLLILPMTGDGVWKIHRFLSVPAFLFSFLENTSSPLGATAEIQERFSDWLASP
jgi:hypothetical protein